ncbi:ABC transporter ATP-binding protein [Spirillospora sp. NPDC048911]|uniref:ABC transporter ATP-binding protein n=1 Tax=Spirillospora sp. NPDC048911 TaxID=3364527 RepID=UPI003719701A
MKTRIIQDQPAPAAVIEVRELTKHYGHVRAVDRLSFAVREGVVAGLLGSDGSGKTTTLRSVLGLVKPTSGHAMIAGMPYRRLRHPLREVGAMLEPAAHPGRTARDHLRMVAAEARMPSSRADELLDLVELRAAAGRRAGGYSSAMRRRLGLAAALIGDPRILVLDEPADGLDPEGVRRLRDLLRALAAEGRTVLLTSHVPSEVAQLVDEVIVIDDGRLVAQAPLDRVIGPGRRIRVRSPRPVELAAALRADGLLAVQDGTGTLTVAGAAQETVGQLAFDRGFPLYEISAESPGLAETLLRLTGEETRT